MTYSVTFYISDEEVKKAIKKFGSLEKYKKEVRTFAKKLLEGENV